MTRLAQRLGVHGVEVATTRCDRSTVVDDARWLAASLAVRVLVENAVAERTPLGIAVETERSLRILSSLHCTLVLNAEPLVRELRAARVSARRREAVGHGVVLIKTVAQITVADPLRRPGYAALRG